MGAREVEVVRFRELHRKPAIERQRKFFNHRTVGPVRYTSSGQFGYHGTFSFGNFQKTASGSIDVDDYSDNHDSGKLDIVAVSPSPSLPKDGEVVNFTVKVKNLYSTGQNMRLELLVDGSVVDSAQGVINANSEKTFSLHWLAEAGQHSYTVKAYTLIGGQKFIRDEERGSVIVSSSQLLGGFDISSAEVYQGDTVVFHYIVRPTESAGLKNPTVSLQIEGGDRFFSKTYYGATVTWDNYIDDRTEYKFSEAGNYTVLLLVNGAVVYSKNIEVKPLQGMVVKLDCPEEPVLLGETAICKIVVENNPVNQDLYYSISSKKLDYNSNAGNVISISRLKDIIPAGYLGQIAQINVPLDENLASALGLDDVRDLTPYTTHWVCPDGSCYYTRDRSDTPHYLSMALWIENLGGKNLDNVIIARYEGSKYWNEDANGGIKKGALMIIAPLGLAYVPVDYMGTVIVEMTPAPKPVKTIIQVFLFAKSIGQSIWKEINFGG